MLPPTFSSCPLRFFVHHGPSRLILGVCALMLLALGSTPALGHDQSHQQHREMAKADMRATRVELDVPDLLLTNQDGRQAKLVSEYIGNRTVAFTFVYTSCTTICPVINGIFKRLQTRIGPELGQKIAMLTLTIDSVVDIPARLKEHTENLGIKPGWDFLTGDRDTVKQILKALEVYTPDIANHPPVVFVIDGSKGEWYRLNGFSSPELIEQTLRQHLDKS